MKNIIILLVFISTLTGNKPADTINFPTYDISFAIEKGLISYHANGNSDSPHYYQPLVLHLKNNSTKKFNIRIPNGQTFQSVSENHQDIIVTNEELIALDQNESVKKALLGMCIQQFNAAPNTSEEYSLGPLASDNLFKLSQEIQIKKTFNTLGQYAVWAVTDESDLNRIDGFDRKEASYLKEFVANLLGVPVPEYNPEEAYGYDDTTVIKRTVGGTFKYKFSKTSSVTIGMFDENDIIVRELLFNPNTPPGQHSMSYEFNTEVHTDDVYYIRLIIDGQIKVNFEMKTRRS